MRGSLNGKDDDEKKDADDAESDPAGAGGRLRVGRAAAVVEAFSDGCE